MQQLLRSIFISGFPLFALYTLISNGHDLYKENNAYHVIGSLIVALTIVSFFSGLFIFQRARTKKRLPVYSIFVVLGLLVSILMQLTNQHIQPAYLISPILLVLGWTAYITWYSTFKKRKKNMLTIGNILPEFELENTSKNILSSRSFLGKPAVLLFYRGNWCPLCMAQIKEISKQYKEIEKLGAQVFMISPQPHKYSASLARKYNLNFQFLTDVNNKAASKLQILSKHGIPAGFQVLGYDSDTVLPTVIITDKKGKIIFADLTDNYRVRPEPDTFLAVLKTIT